MNNYEYIIASLPVLSKDWKASKGIDCNEIVSQIRQQCSKKDNELIDLLEDGHDNSKLGKEFYDKALASKNKFIREYFTFDLKMRNAKVRYLNTALGRDENQDIFADPECKPEEKEKLDSVFTSNDILERERNIDNLMWETIDSITLFDYFDIDAILGFIARLYIIGRWLKLDEKTGREMFRKLVSEVRGTYSGVKYNE